ncbi:hypothetical protein LCGC14_2452170, partial [marine sediment metagenome]
MVTRSERPKPKWRRKWSRAAPGTRRTAGAALGDMFQRKRAGALLPAVLAVSLLLHGVATPFLIRYRGMSLEEIAASEDSYLRKILEKERARKISRKVQSRLTMPPPPPDPEAVVTETLTDALT